VKNPNQVISMGDSYINWVSHTFPADLNARRSDFPANLRDRRLLHGSGGIGLIPTEFDTALTADPDIIAVVLDSGGNDVLVAAPGRLDCKNMANAGSVPLYQVIVTDAIAAGDKLATRMNRCWRARRRLLLLPSRSRAHLHRRVVPERDALECPPRPLSPRNAGIQQHRAIPQELRSGKRHPNRASRHDPGVGLLHQVSLCRRLSTAGDDARPRQCSESSAPPR